jgi:hypothetical protein
MKTRLLLAVAFLTIAGYATADPAPFPPSIVVVADWAAARGELVCETLVRESVPVTREVIVNKGGVATKALITEIAVRTTKQRTTYAVKECEFMTADGKQLTEAEAKKQAPPGALIAVSPFPGKVDPAYLKIFKGDTLIVVSKTQGVPVVEPAPKLPPPK